MLLDLLFGSYRQRALSQLFLNPDSSYHVRELARLTDTTPGTLHKELSRLSESGLLKREKLGNQIRYQANRDHPVFAELAGLLRKTSGAPVILAEALGKLDPAPALALIFGSVARGEETRLSDIDLLVITETSFADIVKALHPAQIQLQREINPVVYSPVEFAQRAARKDAFLTQLLANKKLFIIGNENDLGKLASHTPATTV